ncbi:MAG: hypothetical protein H7333_11765, partial [Bdellovibrionales bacterium]|nr:hypothetical protein [Oligoflexia bacterium]
QNKVLIIDGNPHAVYQINLSSPVDRLWSWEIVVDASSGFVHRSVSRAYFYGPDKDSRVANLKVFDPNPTLKLGGRYGKTNGFKDNDNQNNAFFEQALTSAQSEVDFHNGTYSLQNRYVQITDLQKPSNPNCSNSTGVFDFNRSDACFDSVNAFYFVTKSLQYLNETLGIKAAPLRYLGGVKVDPQGLDGDDNSYYDSDEDTLVYGTGGVDDAQDHDVILHELGHAIHQWITHGHMSRVEGLSEGIGDYWAASYSRSWMKPDHPAYSWVYSFDGHNEYWPGRMVNTAGTYPDAAQNEMHDSGSLWASTCMEIYEAIGRRKMDRIFWSGISMLNERSNQLDAANALMLAAQELYGDEPDTLRLIRQKFILRGYTVPEIRKWRSLRLRPEPCRAGGLCV